VTKSPSKLNLSGSLEDYLETILLLARKHDQVRVKDIAAEREVRAPSVSLALGKLSDMGLVAHHRREFVELTPTGEREALRVYSRHTLLTRFFAEILQMSPEAAAEQACAMEHVLTDDGMDRLTRFFEYLTCCPSVSQDFLKDFQRCPIVSSSSLHCGPSTDGSFACATPCHHDNEHLQPQSRTIMSLSKLAPGARGIVARIDAQGAIRQRLLDMGLLPDVELTVERVAPSGDPIWIKLEGSQIALRLKEAQAVCLVTK